MYVYAHTLDLFPHLRNEYDDIETEIVAHRTLAHVLLRNSIKISNTLAFTNWGYKAQLTTITAQQLLDQADTLPDNKKIPGFHETYINELKKQLAVS
ncbi:MAG: hypothetical protein WBF39_11025, partial [Planococcus donghaensis]